MVKALGLSLAPSRPPKSTVVRWLCPASPAAKLNTDGSSNQLLHSAGGGGILRHATGTFLFAYADKYSYCTCLEAEANA
ncbi:hypothetical protein PSY81_23525, partial [Shigella flexneri]|nr:hypothetical protein [Shigella flexneri]